MRKTFMQAFDPYLQDSTNMLSNYLLQQGEDKRKKIEAQKQTGILQQLISGKKTSFSYGGKLSPLIPQQVDLGQEDVVNLLSGADDNTLQRFNLFRGMNKPKEVPKKELYQFDGNLYERTPEGGLGDLIKEKTKEPKKPEKVWIKDENWGDKVKKLMGYEDPNADENDKERTRVVNGKKYTVTDWTSTDKYEKKTSSNGENRFSLKDEIKKSLGDYYKKQQEYLAVTNAGFGNKPVGKEDKTTFADKLKNHNKIYSEAVKNVMSQSARGWYDNLYNYQDENKQMGNPDPEDYWNVLKQDYVSGKLGKDPNKEDNYEDADFQVLTENFKAIYGFDPTQVYGY